LNDTGATKRRWFSRGDDDTLNAMSDRLRVLREVMIEVGVDNTPAADEPAALRRPADAELLFTGGPRTGERLPLEARRIALDRDANETAEDSKSAMVASVWAQGEHFMLRHGGAILIGGARPALPIVVLEDGDELQWGVHRLQFRSGHSVGR
jgi:hypothetical protein